MRHGPYSPPRTTNLEVRTTSTPTGRHARTATQNRKQYVTYPSSLCATNYLGHQNDDSQQHPELLLQPSRTASVDLHPNLPLGAKHSVARCDGSALRQFRAFVYSALRHLDGISDNLGSISPIGPRSVGGWLPSVCSAEIFDVYYAVFV